MIGVAFCRIPYGVIIKHNYAVACTICCGFFRPVAWTSVFFSLIFICVTLDKQNRAAAIVRSGQQLSYTEHGLSDISRTDAESVTAWRKNRLIFRDTPLDEVVR
jgi:hypothetical protein